MEPQEIFDYVTLNLMKQGKRAIELHPTYDFGERCVYHSSTGLKCSVGFLIPKLYYREGMEGYNVDHDVMINYMPSWYKKNISLIKDLQNVHDNPRHWTTEKVLKDELTRIANAHKLKSSVIYMPNYSYTKIQNIETKLKKSFEVG